MSVIQTKLHIHVHLEYIWIEFNLPPYTTKCILSLHALGPINVENLESISDIKAQKHASTYKSSCHTK